jgi:hypothetical protein
VSRYLLDDAGLSLELEAGGVAELPAPQAEL